MVRKTEPPVPGAPRHNPIMKPLARLGLEGRWETASSTLTGRRAKSWIFSDVMVVMVALRKERTRKRGELYTDWQ